MRYLLRSSICIALFLSGCGADEAPPAQPPAVQTAQPAHPPAAGQAAQPDDADARFTGVVHLEGDLAAAEKGFVFISVKPKGVQMPAYSRKYSLADPEVGPAGASPRLLTFELDAAHKMGGFGSGEHFLEAWFDPDGFVETKEGVRATVPVGRGQEGVEVHLRSPEPASDAPQAPKDG